MLDRAAQIWTFLQLEGGLDLDFHVDMDGEIVHTLCSKLGLDDTEDIENELECRGTTVEQFIEAFLTALGPYSAMMNDLLAMFERAGATQTDHALHVRFDFGQELDLEFDIKHFRDWIEVVNKVRSVVNVSVLDYDAVWKLMRVLHTDTSGPLSRDRHLPREPEVARWHVDYGQFRRWPDFDPGPPSTGDTELDELLARVHATWRDVVEAARSVGPTRYDLQRIRDLEGEPSFKGWPLKMVAHMDTDLWAASILDSMYAAARETRHGRAAGLADALREFFDALPTTRIERDALERTLLDFLNLPIWKRRYELYSAWIVTQILEAGSACAPRMHIRDGKISFAFGGSHLATFDHLRPAVHLWAELRSPVDAELTGLEKHIQPDYTLIADPITADSSAVVVVECKQYRRESRKNFGHAVHKYAIGRPNAAILLVNYGPARMSLLTGLPLTDEQRRRIHIFGHVRPNAPALPEFRRAIADALGSPATTAPPSMGLERIELLWDGDVDLDLWLLIEGDTEVSYQNVGSTDAEPWAALDYDVRSSGLETITLARTLPARYRCFVHNYDGGDKEFPQGAGVTIVHGGGTAIRIPIPKDGKGDYWHVVDYDGASGAVVIVNRICEAEPAL